MTAETPKQKPAALFQKTESGILLLRNVVASFPHLAEPDSFDGTPEKMKYSVNALIPISDSPAWEAMLAEIRAQVPDKWSPKDKSKLPFGETSKAPESFQDLHGVSAFVAKFVSKRQPRTFDAAGLCAPETIEAGDIVSVGFELFFFSNKKYGDFVQLQVKSVKREAEYLKFASAHESDGSEFGDFQTTPPRNAADASAAFDDEIGF